MVVAPPRVLHAAGSLGLYKGSLGKGLEAHLISHLSLPKRSRRNSLVFAGKFEALAGAPFVCLEGFQWCFGILEET